MPEPIAALYQRDGNIWLPQEAGIGPWSPDALHGGPVAALCVSAAEELLPGDNLATTRLTLELVRPVPLRPLQVNARVIKEGRRVNLIDIEVLDGGRPAALARVQRTTLASLPLEDGAKLAAQHAPPDCPEDFSLFEMSQAPRRPAPFFRMATEMRTREPAGIFAPGPTLAWLRVYADLLPGVPLSHAAAVVAAADYTNALAAPIAPSQSKILFPNADLTVHLVRTPVDAWVRMEPRGHWHDEGLGHAHCVLSDRRGLLGISAATLPLASREGMK